ncbi:MAG: proline dehydrogenase family protein, partial [Candidatus Nanohaloarchaea archaeon]|nr:proline dehydrogenase family protein [Candidatus Nanohaloarchaea archaeon]
MAVIRRLLLPFARRFVAGESVESAVAHVRDRNEDGVVAYIDLLGEHVAEREVAEAARDEYIDLLDRLDEEELDAGLSIKPTHLGLEIDEQFCRGNIAAILEHAAERDRYVWIDMESSDHTEETLQLYLDLLEEFDDVGVCIQSYLKRSREDVERVVAADGDIRLVKGAYDEPPTVAYQDRAAVDENFRELLEVLFDTDAFVAVATHDEDLIAHAQDLAAEYGRPRDAFAFQFLMGVRDDLAAELAADGYRVGEYVPYGPEWLSYYWRRVRERKENLFFALR